MQLWTVLWRSVLSFLSLLTIARVLGNQQISQMTYFSYILGIAIGNIAGGLAANLMERAEIQFVALVTWGVLAYLAGVGAIKHLTFRAVVEGEPLLLIKGGTILERNMAKGKFNMNELLALLRNQQVFDPSQVDIAILETNGQLSVLLKPEHQPATRGSLGIPRQDNGPQQVPTELIIDGTVLDENLAAIGRDEAWLLRELRAQGVADAGSVALAMVVPSGTLLIDRRSARRPRARPAGTRQPPTYQLKKRRSSPVDENRRAERDQKQHHEDEPRP